MRMASNFLACTQKFSIRPQSGPSLQKCDPCSLKLIQLFQSKGRRRMVAAGAADTLVVVESPAKAEKIQKFLGSGYQVMASIGHIRDLPPKQGSVLPEQDFEVLWEVKKGAQSRIDQMAEGLRGARRLILATDPDREGEAISWHVLQAMMERMALRGVSVERITFTEVTKQAVLDALKQPRQVCQPLVDAYLARRALDYLVGFNISPLLWRKLPGAKSAGRVQSVALRLVCERETEVTAFQPQEYWSLPAVLVDGGGARHPAELTRLAGKRLAKMAMGSAEAAEQARREVEAASFKVADVSSKTLQRSPGPPFITSTLQQEASRKLGWGASRTMQAAQQLYEGAGAGEGLITYMRTDGVQLSGEAVAALREAVTSQFGAAYVPPQPRFYKSRAKNAQEAHEAIRPTKPYLSPKDLPGGVNEDQRRLYDLIWRRALACQMASAQIQQVAVDAVSADGAITLRSGGSAVKFAGYLRAYDDTAPSKEDPETAPGDEPLRQDDARTQALLKLKPQSPVTVTEVKPEQHFTKPPGRFTEGTLVKALEEKGIGRPSTYASIIKLLQERSYMLKEGSSLRPSPLGQVLTTFLVRYFERYLDYEFTSNMEEQLDQVSGGHAAWRTVLHDFWGPFRGSLDSLTPLRTTEVFDFLDEHLGPVFLPPRADGADPRRCPACGGGRLQLKPSRYGGFIGCSNYSKEEGGCGYKVALDQAAAVLSGSGEEGTEGSILEPGVKVLGSDPATGRPVSLRMGRFGAYVQLGSAKEEGEEAKLKRAPLPKKKEPSSLTLAEALRLLELPRELGPHPGDGQPVTADAGRFGPYVAHAGIYAPIPKGEAPQHISMERALELLEAKRQKMIAKGIDPAQAAEARRKKLEARRAKKGGKKAAGTRVGPAKLNGWILYQQQQRAAAKAQHPKAKPAELLKLLAADWKALDAAGKRHYQQQADAHNEAGGAAAGGKASGRASSSQGKAAKGSSRGGVAKEGSGSKLTGWLLFQQQQRPKLKAQHPQAKPSELIKLLAGDWKALDEGAKQQYQQLATSRNSAEAANATEVTGEAGGQAVARTAAGSGAAKAGGKTNGWLVFQRQHRPRFKVEHPSASPAALLQLMAAEWKLLDSGAKQSYQQAGGTDSAVEQHAAPAGTSGRAALETPGNGRGRRRSSTPPVVADQEAASPERARSGWQVYVQQNRPRLAAEQPGVSSSGLLALLGAEWRGLGEDGQERWKTAAAGGSAASPTAPAGNGNGTVGDESRGGDAVHVPSDARGAGGAGEQLVGSSRSRKRTNSARSKS